MARHLIHIGYPKAGSHFVKRWFAAHPQLDYAEGGLAGFTCVGDVARQGLSPRPTILFRVTSGEELAVPSDANDPFYAERFTFDTDAQAEVCKILQSLFPSATILLLTRGFRSMMLSGYSEFVRHGGARDFGFLDPNPRSRQSLGDPWNYDTLIRLYREGFDGRLIVLPYELLRDDPDAFVRELERRLGLDHHDVPLDRIYPSLSPVEMRWYPRITRLVKRLPLGKRLRHRLFRAYLGTLWENRWRRPIRVLQRLFPAMPVTADLIPPRAIEPLRGRADSLRGDSLYEPYRSDYLL